MSSEDLRQQIFKRVEEIKSTLLLPQTIPPPAKPKVTRIRTPHPLSSPQAQPIFRVDPNYIKAVNNLAEVLEDLKNLPSQKVGAVEPPTNIVKKLDRIAYLLEGPDQVYPDTLTATASEQTLRFTSDKPNGIGIRSISLKNSGTATVYLLFDAPAYKSKRKKFRLTSGSSLAVDFMEKATKMEYWCDAGNTTTVEVFAGLKYMRKFD